MSFLSFLPTYRQRNLFLLGIGLLSLLLVYLLSIRRTVAVYQANRANKAAIAQAASAPAQIARLEAQVGALQQSGLRAYDREYLLAQITGFCRQNDLLVRTFPQSERVVENNYPIITNTIEVEGNYKDLVRLVYLLEQEERLASVSSLKFYTQKDRLTKKNVSSAKYYLTQSGGLRKPPFA